MPLDVNKYCYKDQGQPLTQIWKFIIAFAIVQFIYYLLVSNLITSFCLVLVSWGLLLFIPCLIRYVFGKILSTKLAIIYTVINVVFFVTLNVIVDILCKEYLGTNQTITIWNLLMLVTPYYLLTNKPIFTRKLQKNIYFMDNPELAEKKTKEFEEQL